MIVSLEEMKQYLRVDFDDDDSLIETLITLFRSPREQVLLFGASSNPELDGFLWTLQRSYKTHLFTGPVGIISYRPSFFIFFVKTGLSSPLDSGGRYFYLFSAKPLSRLHLVVRNFLRLEAIMQENITTSIPVSASPKPIQQADIEQDYNFFQAQKVAQNMLELGLISLSEFNKLSLKNRETFSPFWVEIMPEIR